jgi:hypothetical protein
MQLEAAFSKVKANLRPRTRSGKPSAIWSPEECRNNFTAAAYGFV